MRTLTLTLALGLAGSPVVGTADEEPADKTRVVIGQPKLTGNPPTQAAFKVSMQLDGNEKAFAGLAIIVVEKGKAGAKSVAASLEPYKGPAPGGGPATAAITFPVTTGAIYQVDILMRYTNSMGGEATRSDTAKITP